jgi:hypothetical protein
MGMRLGVSLKVENREARKYLEQEREINGEIHKLNDNNKDFIIIYDS